MSTVAVIDYGGSNLRSVVKALETVAAGRHRIIVADDARRVADADRVVFPGQGAIGECMARLDEHGLIDVIRECAFTRPFLGICLGLQSLVSHSAEDGGTACLDIFPGTVVHFPPNPPPAADGSPRKIPHMGWNQVAWTRDHPVSHGIASNTRFYFVHSYYVVPEDPTLTLAYTDYIAPFTAAVARGYVIATQFHPEKSAQAGLKLLGNFLAWN